MPAAQASRAARRRPRGHSSTGPNSLRTHGARRLIEVKVVGLADAAGRGADPHRRPEGRERRHPPAADSARTSRSRRPRWAIARPRAIFKGQIAAVEPEFGAKGCTIAVRAYDKSHKLNRVRKVRTFQQMSASDMVRKVVRGRPALQVEAESTDGRLRVLPAEQRDGLGLPVAARADARLRGGRRRHEARSSAPRAAPAARRSTLRWQDNTDLVPPADHRASSRSDDGQRARLGSEEQEGRSNGSAGQRRTTSSKAGRASARTVANDLGGGTTTVTDRVADDRRRGERDRQEHAQPHWPTRSTRPTASHSASPRSRPAARSRSRASASSSAATFTVTSSTHSYRGTTGYQTSFQISGRSSRTLLELMRPPDNRATGRRPSWSAW